MVREHVENESGMFMLTYGDGVADIDIDALMEFHLSHDKIGTVTGVSEPLRYGMITEKDNQALSFGEKKGKDSNLINGGFFVFNIDFLEYIGDSLDTKLENEPLSALAEDGQLMVYLHDSRWACADMAREIDELNDLYYKGGAFWIS